MTNRILIPLLLSIFCGFSKSCPPNSYDNQLDGCVYLQQAAPFDTAEASCNSLGGHLVSTHNAFENADISNLRLSAGFQRFFLGAKRYVYNGSFVNVDGSPFGYQAWAFGQPLTDSCISVQSQSQQWYTTDCQSPLPSICLVKQAPTVSPSNQCPYGWSFFAGTGACYYKGGSGSFYDAQSACQAMGANLASIHSEDENTFILGLTMGYTTSCTTTNGNYFILWIGGDPIILGFLNADHLGRGLANQLFFYAPSHAKDPDSHDWHVIASVYNHDWQWTDGTSFDYRRFYGHDDPSTGSLSLTSESGCADFTYWRVRSPAQVLPYYVCKKQPGF